MRKAIKLTLQDPNNSEYREFTDQLLAIYREACRVQSDRRLGDAGRAQKVVGLADAIFDLCADRWCEKLSGFRGLAKDYRLLIHELMRLMSDNELFTFVTAPAVEQVDGTTEPVAGTNNEAERTLRGTAQARKTGRTNKTMTGARRQTILMSVLESLRLYLPTFTLKTVFDEVRSWWAVDAVASMLAAGNEAQISQEAGARSAVSETDRRPKWITSCRGPTPRATSRPPKRRPRGQYAITPRFTP